MLEIIVIIATALVPDHAADGLARTAPLDIARAAARAGVDVRTEARRHIGAAVVAGIATGTDPSMLLAIAWRESRYSQREVTRERNGVSCGVLTPEPTHDPVACRGATRSLAAGYMAGAIHLRAWLDAYGGSEWLASLGYAGGGEHGLVGACRRGPVMVKRGNAIADACVFVPHVIDDRAALIRSALDVDARREVPAS